MFYQSWSVRKVQKDLFVFGGKFVLHVWKLSVLVHEDSRIQKHLHCLKRSNLVTSDDFSVLLSGYSRKSASCADVFPLHTGFVGEGRFFHCCVCFSGFCEPSKTLHDIHRSQHSAAPCNRGDPRGQPLL